MNVLIVGFGVYRDFGLKSLVRAGHVVGVVDDVSHVPVDFVDWYHPFSASSVEDPRLLAEASGIAWDVVLCWGEYSLTDAIRFAERLELPGPRLDVPSFRDKSRMRDLLTGAGMRTPAFTSTDSPEAAARWAEGRPLPLIVKPVDYAGSSGVRLASSIDEVVTAAAAAVSKSFSGRCVVEEVLAGPEFSIESVTWGRGRHVTYGITEKRLGPKPHFVEAGHVFPAALDDVVTKQIVEEVHSALDLFGMERGSSHAEVILTQDGPVIVEIGGRLGGDLIPRLVWEASGVDLYLEELDAISGTDRPPAEPDRSGRTSAVRFLDATPGTRITWPSASAVKGTRAEPVLRDLAHWYPHYVDAPVVDGAGRRLGYCLLTGEDRAAVLAGYDDAAVLCPPEVVAP